MPLIDPDTGVEYDAGDDAKKDRPDPPRNPRYDPLNPRELEVALKRYRIRFNWREPDEDKTGAEAEENEGMSNGQSHATKYKIEVQNKPTNKSWQTVETAYTRNNHYVYHSVAGESDLLAAYRARIWSVDKDEDLSSQWLNSNDGRLYGGEYSGGDTKLLGGGEKQTISFSHAGELEIPKVFETAWTSDGSYVITKISARVGVHNNEHPDDGCPRGGAIKINIRKYDKSEDDFVKVLANDERLTIGGGKHKDTAWVKDILRPKVFEDEILAVSIVKENSVWYNGRGLVVNIVLEPT